jgi:predicted nuclease of predicted toxin-antitoxin system
MKFATDENFNGRILGALLQQLPHLDVVRVQDTAIAGASDPILLDWIAQENRILLTHDVTTMTSFAYQRLANGQSFPGIILVRANAQFSTVVEDLLLLIEVSQEVEWTDQIHYVPL